MEGGCPIEKNKIMIVYIDIEIIIEKIRVLERINREFITQLSQQKFVNKACIKAA